VTEYIYQITDCDNCPLNDGRCQEYGSNCIPPEGPCVSWSSKDKNMRVEDWWQRMLGYMAARDAEYEREDRYRKADEAKKAEQHRKRSAAAIKAAHTRRVNKAKVLSLRTGESFERCYNYLWLRKGQRRG
jgi:hypothetical protein